MQKQTTVLLLVGLLAVVAGIFLAPSFFGEAPAPVMQWDAADEVDGAEEEQPEAGEVATAEFDRTEVETTPGAPPVDDAAPMPSPGAPIARSA